MELSKNPANKNKKSKSKKSSNLIKIEEKTTLEKILDYNGIPAAERELFLSGSLNNKKNERIYSRFAGKIKRVMSEKKKIKIIASYNKESLIPAIFLKRCFDDLSYGKFVTITNSPSQIRKSDIVIAVNRDIPEKVLKKANMRLKDVIILKDGRNPEFFNRGTNSRNDALFHIWMIMHYYSRGTSRYYQERIEKELMFYSIFTHTLNSSLAGESRALYLKGLEVASKTKSPMMKGFLKFLNSKKMDRLAVKYFGESLMFLFILNYKRDDIIKFLTVDSKPITFNNFLALKAEVSVIRDEILELEGDMIRSFEKQKNLINRPILVARSEKKLYKRPAMIGLSLKRFYKVFNKPIIFSIRESTGTYQYAIGLNGKEDYGGYIKDGIWRFELPKEDRAKMRSLAKYDTTKLKNKKYIRIELEDVVDVKSDVDHLAPYGNGFLEPEFEVIVNNESIKGKIGDIMEELNLKWEYLVQSPLLKKWDKVLRRFMKKKALW